MGISAVFGKMNFSDLQGIRISARFRPQTGFSNELWVYLASLYPAATPLPEIAFDQQLGAIRDNLVVQGADPRFTYTFKGIELVRTFTEVSRRQRLQIAEFQLRAAPADTSVLVELDHAGTQDVPNDNALKDRYLVKVGEESAEELLYFGGLVTERAGQGFHFAKLRNSKKSWFHELVKWDENVRKKTAYDGFNLGGFGALPNGSLKLNTANTRAIYYQEAWGVALDWPMLDLESSVTSSGGGVSARVRFPAANFAQMDHHLQNTQFDSATHGHGAAVEMGSVILTSALHDIKVQ